MDFAIRPAQPADAASIAHVHLESWKTTYPGIIPEAYIAALNEQTGTQNWQQYLQDSTVSAFVAETGSEIFGFIAGGPIREPISNYDAELYSIYLLRSHHQQGAGRALVRTLANALHSQGYRSMIVWALEANAAVHFYRRLGAVDVTRKRVNIGGADLADLALGWPTLHPLQ